MCPQVRAPVLFSPCGIVIAFARPSTHQFGYSAATCDVDRLPTPASQGHSGTRTDAPDSMQHLKQYDNNSESVPPCVFRERHELEPRRNATGRARLPLITQRYPQGGPPASELLSKCTTAHVEPKSRRPSRVQAHAGTAEVSHGSTPSAPHYVASAWSETLLWHPPRSMTRTGEDIRNVRIKGAEIGKRIKYGPVDLESDSARTTTKLILTM
jgi:hypothetical protein